MVRALGADASTPAAIIVVFNGNAGNRSHRAPLAQRLADAGYATVLADYRGYGGNPGSPSERGLLADARAVVDAVIDAEHVDASRLVYFGESLGSGRRRATGASSRPPAGARAPVAVHVDRRCRRPSLLVPARAAPAVGPLRLAVAHRPACDARC